MISGISAALISPLDKHGRLDHRSLEQIICRILVADVSGLSPAGSVGEGPRLTHDTRLALATEVRRLAPRGVNVLPNVPCNNVEDCLLEINQLADVGCTAVLVAPPPYYPLLEGDVRHFYEILADGSPVPVVLYNIPQFTKIHISPDAVRVLASHPGVAGIKDSSGDATYFGQVVSAAKRQPDFAVLTGADGCLLENLMLGGDGAILASVNLVPELAVGILQSYREGRTADARQLQERLTQVVQACRRGNFPAGWKAALEINGLSQSWLASPASHLTPADRDQLTSGLAGLDLSGASPGIAGYAAALASKPPRTSTAPEHHTASPGGTP